MKKKTYVQTGSSLLQNKLYVRMYSAYAAASFGDWFDVLAVQVLVGYRWQASPLMLALIPVAMAVPGILLGSLAGVAADRLNPLKLMRRCDLVTALLTALLLFAPNMQVLLPLLALRAAISTFNVPAQQSLTRRIVREEQLLQATSLNGIVNQGSKIAGPLLGGFALSVLSPQWCILLNVLMRGSSYLLLLTARDAGGEEGAAAAGSPAGREEKLPLFTLWQDGWRQICRNRLLLSSMLFGLIGMLVIQMIDFQFTSLFRFLAPGEESMLGWMVAASGVGAVLVIALMGKLNRSAGGYGRKLGTGYVLIGMAVGGLGLLEEGVTVLPVLLLGVLLGFGNGITMITFNYCLQKETPPHMTGRVFGIQNTIQSAVMIGAPLIGGLLVQTAGPARVFMNFGVAIILIGGCAILFGRMFWPENKRDQGVNPGEGQVQGHL